MQKRGRAKKDQILVTSRQLFTDKNYFNVSTNEIARQAGVSIGTLYAYFSSKEDILIELLKNYNESFLPIFESINSKNSFYTFKTDTKVWLAALIEQLMNTEDQKFHLQIETLAITIPEAQTFLEVHNEKIKNLTYECFLYYADQTDVHEIKILATVVFDYLSALVDELLYHDHTSDEKEAIKQCGIDSIYTIIKTLLV
ncbi:TetR/AcrR family transcriptional regulator [Lactiplantibacillus carotarum]|uniref:TetR/AcrR family transcriptional regulator n=1 Tax=Lactiplantibacillus carotarum TaxID=2993456 RepID=UPI00298F2905|nr:TetR/AcrR family transcriptional regulator [Lactiplantibacillus carotarum]